MSIPATEAPIPETPISLKDRTKSALVKARRVSGSRIKSAVKWADIKRLQAAEKYLRARSLRLLLVQAAGGYAAFHGVYLYSHRVAFIVLGVGVILAAERQ